MLQRSILQLCRPNKTARELLDIHVQYQDTNRQSRAILSSSYVEHIKTLFTERDI